MFVHQTAENKKELMGGGSCVIHGRVKGRGGIRCSTTSPCASRVRVCSCVCTGAPVNSEPKLRGAKSELCAPRSASPAQLAWNWSVTRNQYENKTGQILKRGCTYAAVLSGPVDHRVVMRRVSSQSESAAGELGLILAGISSPFVPVPPDFGPALFVRV